MEATATDQHPRERASSADPGEAADALVVLGINGDLAKVMRRQQE